MGLRSSVFLTFFTAILSVLARGPCRMVASNTSAMSLVYLASGCQPLHPLSLHGWAGALWSAPEGSLPGAGGNRGYGGAGAVSPNLWNIPYPPSVPAPTGKCSNLAVILCGSYLWVTARTVRVCCVLTALPWRPPGPVSCGSAHSSPQQQQRPCSLPLLHHGDTSGVILPRGSRVDSYTFLAVIPADETIRFLH